MRIAFVGLVAVMSLVSASAMAKSPSGGNTMKACAASWQSMTAADKAKTTYKAYSTSCLSGATAALATVPAAATAAAVVKAAPAKATVAMKALPAKADAPAGVPTGATAKCKDGTFSMSKTHSGSCSSHGGVASFL